MAERSPLLSCAAPRGRLAIAALALVAAGCGPADRTRAAGDVATKPPPVEAVPVREGPLPRQETLSGVVRSRDQVAIRPQIEASVVEVLVRSGDAVERGQPLVRLESDRLREQLRQAEAAVALAEAQAAEARAQLAEIDAQATRSRALAAEELISELDLATLEARVDAGRARAAQAEARVEQAKATVSERRTALGKTLVRAPVGGRVGQRAVEPGMLVDSSTTMFLLGGLDDLIVEVPLTEEMVGRIEPGTPVAIRAAALEGQPLSAEVSRISPFLEEESFSTVGEIDVANPGSLRPGMFVTVDLLYGESDRGSLVPETALWEDPDTGEPGVWVVEEADALAEPARTGTEVPERTRRVVFRPVEVRARGRGMVGAAGVAPGEWVVTLGQHLLQEEEAAAEEKAVTARVRPTTWEHVLGLQDLQQEDLLRQFLEKQRKVARALGTEIPESEAEVDAILNRATPGS